MKRAWKDRLPAGIVLLLLMMAVSCREKSAQHTGHEHTQYTCPMHPQVIKDSPGSCPICGMELVPIHRGGTEMTFSDSLSRLLKPTDQVVVSNVKTVHPHSGSRFEDVVFRGVLGYNTNRLNIVSSRVSGRIEKLYVKYNFQAVGRGQKLMDIYSPDLASAQQELLFLRDNHEPELLNAAKQKLRLLGATEKQISKVLATGTVSYRFSVYSPYSGYVTGQSSGANPSSVPALPVSAISGGASSSGAMSGGMGDGMAGASAPDASTPPTATAEGPLLLREGQYVSAGQQLFSMIDPGELWVEFYAEPGQLPLLQKGAEITVSIGELAGGGVKARISRIQPFYKEGASFPLVRAVLINPSGRWKAGQYVDVLISGRKKEGNWLPRTAVLQLGTRSVVFVKHDGVFVPQYVDVAGRAGDWTDVGNSLVHTEEVAENAWFMIDSESFVKGQDPSSARNE